MNKKLKEVALHEKDTGSSEAQIALLTDKIENLSAHMKKFKKDKHSSVGLLKAVNKRKKLLDYLKKNKSDAYKNILTKLNLRKQMFKVFKKEINFGGKKITLETGKVARQADGAIIATCGETVVLATAVVQKK